MARKSRQREEWLPHHIISRSIMEIDLFSEDEDKKLYLRLLNTGAKKYKIEILAYCLMSNHVHLMVHPSGGNISDFMRYVNGLYARLFNKNHNRRGSLFSERFKNVIIRTNNQLLRTSTYIHNNVKDLLYNRYKSLEDYPFSSLQYYFEPAKSPPELKVKNVLNILHVEVEKAVDSYKSLMVIQAQQAY